MYGDVPMSHPPKVQSGLDLSPAWHLERLEAAAVFLAEAQAEVVVRRAELDRRIVAASGSKLSLRAIARQVNLSHTKVQTIVGEAE